MLKIKTIIVLAICCLWIVAKKYTHEHFTSIFQRLQKEDKFINNTFMFINEVALFIIGRHSGSKNHRIYISLTLGQ
jgi:hypothetical protein